MAHPMSEGELRMDSMPIFPRGITGNHTPAIRPSDWHGDCNDCGDERTPPRSDNGHAADEIVSIQGAFGCLSIRLRVVPRENQRWESCGCGLIRALGSQGMKGLDLLCKPNATGGVNEAAQGKIEVRHVANFEDHDEKEIVYGME